MGEWRLEGGARGVAGVCIRRDPQSLARVIHGRKCLVPEWNKRPDTRGLNTFGPYSAPRLRTWGSRATIISGLPPPSRLPKGSTHRRLWMHVPSR